MCGYPDAPLLYEAGEQFDRIECTSDHTSMKQTVVRRTYMNWCDNSTRIHSADIRYVHAEYMQTVRRDARQSKRMEAHRA